MQDFLDWKVLSKLVCPKLNNWLYQLKENQTLVTWENPFWTKGFQCRVEQRQVHGQLLMLQKVYIYIQTCPIMSTLVESCLFLSNPVYSCRILSILFHVVQLHAQWQLSMLKNIYWFLFLRIDFLLLNVASGSSRNHFCTVTYRDSSRRKGRLWSLASFLHIFYEINKISTYLHTFVIKTLQTICILWYDLWVPWPIKKSFNSHTTQLDFCLQIDID